MTTELVSRPLCNRSDVEVTRAGIGLWAVSGSEWGPVDDENSLAAIETALDMGVTFFDTADVYGGGHSEELLGRAMRGRRDRFIVGTKIGWVGFDGDKGQSQYTTVEKLIEGVESNLRRLNTDYVDLIQCHIYFVEPNNDVFVEGFEKLKQQGKVRAFGTSSSGLPVLEAFNHNGNADTMQIDYSILNRDAENEVFPYCREHGIGTIIRGPIAMGLLAGKFDASTTFPEDDFRRNWISGTEGQPDQFRKDLETVEKLLEIAGDMPLAEMALRFVLSSPDVTTVIPGAKNADQARRNIEAMAKGPLDQAILDAIAEVVPFGGGRRIWPADK
ncbi:MAG: aldo/keto reductase [Planctomycetota bacterium]